MVSLKQAASKALRANLDKLFDITMLNLDEIRNQLQKEGIAKLEGFIAGKDAQSAFRQIRALAQEHGLLADGRWIKTHDRFAVPKDFRSALGKLQRHPEFPCLIGEQLSDLVAQLVGSPVALLPPGQQILFSLPGEEIWSIPHDVWHTDMPRFAEAAAPGLQAFALIDSLEPGGGATLVVAGSHRLLNDVGALTSREVKQRLRHEHFFETLFDPRRAPMTALQGVAGHAGNVDLRVVELTGSAGDVYLMDLRMLHTPAPNASNKARMMLTSRFPKRELVPRLLQ